MRYPPPAYALQCWFADGRIRVAIPPTTPEGKGHVVELDMDADGVKTLMFLLKQRIAIKDARIGMPGVPTQAMMDTLQASIKLTVKEPKPAPAALSLEDLGL